MEYSIELERKASSIWRFKSVMAWRVLRPLRKPYWVGERRLLDSRNQKKSLVKYFLEKFTNDRS